jgi:hypothetical protein
MFSRPMKLEHLLFREVTNRLQFGLFRRAGNVIAPIAAKPYQALPAPKPSIDARHARVCGVRCRVAAHRAAKPQGSFSPGFLETLHRIAQQLHRADESSFSTANHERLLQAIRNIKTIKLGSYVTLGNTITELHFKISSNLPNGDED